MKTILWIPFLSLQNKETSCFNLEADQNISFLLNLREELKKDFHIFYLFPYPSLTTNIVFSQKIIKALSPNVIYYDFVGSNIGQRYDFNYHNFMSILEKFNPDIIFNNCDTISKGLKSIVELLGLKTKIFTFYHFLDIPEFEIIPKYSSYFLRQVESAIISDYNGLYSQLNIDIFKKSAKNNFNIDLEQFPFQFFEFVFSLNRLNKEIQSIELKTDKQKKKRIVFPNRLSSNNYSSHIEFIKAVNSLYEKRQDFEVVITNPTGYIPNDILANEVAPIVFPYGKKQLSRKQYLNVLLSSDFVCALFKEIHGGFSIREAIFCGCIPIIPYVNEYARFKDLYYKTYSDFVYVSPTLNNLEETINYWLDVKDINLLVKENAKKELIKTSSIERNYLKLKEALMSL